MAGMRRAGLRFPYSADNYWWVCLPQGSLSN